MTQTMRHTKSNLAMALALLLLAAGGTLRAQVNPATVKNQAQNGVNQAQQTKPPAQVQTPGQTQTKPPAQTPPKNQAQSPAKTPQPSTTKQATPPAKAPATQTAKPPAANATKTPATAGQQPPKTPATKTPAPKTPAANTAKPPATKPPATAGQQPAKTPEKKPATQNQKNGPVKTTPPPKTAPKTGQANHPVPAPAGPASKQTPPRTAAKTPEKKPATTTPAEVKPVPPTVRRDPFVTLVGKHQGGPDAEPVKLPPGKAGLQVNTLVIQGILSSPNGMIAVVANPQRSVYFLHVGDELFDGRVERIEIDGVTFHEVGKDAFGKPLERQVTRKLNPSLGEQP
jgi:Tfp pilus assembly protein PilP